MPKMSLPSLRAMLASQHTDAMAASQASKLSAARSDAANYYNGDMSKDMPAAPGRSSAVSMDVSDTIEGIMPQLMEVFCGSDEVVRFEPVGPEDVQAAEQETDYINHVFMNQNPGFLVLYSFIKDALLSKVGVVKVWWEEEVREQRETYLDKTLDEYLLIASNPDVEIVEHSEHPADGDGGLAGGMVGQAGPDALSQPDGYAQPAIPGGGMGPTGLGIGGQLPQATLHDITVVQKKKYAKARVMGVPPEEFGIERGARTIKDCNYCFHKVVDRTEADLIEQGYDKKQIKRLPTYRSWSNPEEIARDTVDEHTSTGSAEENTATRNVEIVEHYVRMDYRGDGKSCLYKVTTGGTQGEVLELDGEPDIIEFDAIPFAAITPVIVTHRFYGKSVADLVMDIQRIKTALLRALLDNAYLANNPRVEVAESHASENTLDDLLVSRPGSVVRTKQPGGVNWQQIPTIGNHVYPLLEYQDAMKETRTGVTKQGQGIDANALQNQSATAVNQAFTATQARIRLIARNFAETGIKDMMWLLHATIKKHGQEASVVRLRNNWVNVDPRQWKSREDLTVHVGLGTGGRQQRVQELTLLMGVQKDALINGLTNLVSVDNLYSSAKELTKALALPDVDAFFTDPKTQPPLQPKPDPKIMELQMKAQLDERADQRKAQIETVQAQADIATQDRKTQAEIAMAERKFQLDERLALLEHQAKMEDHRANMVRDQQKHSQTIEATRSKDTRAIVEVKHGADEMTGPLSEVVSQLGEHLSKQQAANHQALTAAIEANKPKPSKGKRIKGPSGKIYQIEDVN